MPFWANLLHALRGKPTASASQQSSPPVQWAEKRDTTAGRFMVLDLAYPNHADPSRTPVRPSDLAGRLSFDMDRKWFATDPDFAKFGVSASETRTEDGEDWTMFKFGEYGPDDELVGGGYDLLVRETAGGGMMLMLEKTGAQYGPTIARMFRDIVNQPDRTDQGPQGAP